MRLRLCALLTPFLTFGSIAMAADIVDLNLDSTEHTVYVELRRDTNPSQAYARMRVSKKGKIVQLLNWHGEPLALDTNGNLWGLDTRPFRVRVGQLTDVAIAATAFTMHLDTGLLSYGLLPADLATQFATFSFVTFYLGAVVPSLFLSTPIDTSRIARLVSMGLGGGKNFFRHWIGTSIHSIDQKMSVYTVTFRDGTTSDLRWLMKRDPKLDCADWLTGMTMW